MVAGAQGHVGLCKAWELILGRGWGRGAQGPCQPGWGREELQSLELSVSLEKR